MLIRSQSRCTLLNLDTVEELCIALDRVEDQPDAFKIVTFESGKVSSTIGVYSSEERALAVLDEIMYTYARNKDAENFQAGIPNSCYVFQMPDDDDPCFDGKEGHS